MANKVKSEAVETVKSEPKFPIEKLRQNCLALFGVSSSTFDGATHGLNGEYTVDEMKKTIEKWQKTSIKKEAN